MKTTKLYLAAALISLGAGLKKVDRSDPRHMEFELTFASPVTKEGDWFDSRVREWEDQTLLVNAQDFADAVQQLKAEVHR